MFNGITRSRWSVSQAASFSSGIALLRVWVSKQACKRLEFFSPKKDITCIFYVHTKKSLSFFISVNIYSVTSET